MCYIYCTGVNPDNEMEYIKIVNRAINEGILDKDCTVLDAEKFILWLSGRRVSVQKKKIDKIIEIENSTPVRYAMEGRAGHWVVVENGKIVFNPLLNSINVSKGKPIEARIIKFK